MRSGWTPRRLPTAHLDVSLYYSQVKPSLSAAAAPDTMQLPSRVRGKKNNTVLKCNHVPLLLFPLPSFTSFSSVAEAASQRTSELAGWHPLSPESPAADYGCLCSAHIKRPLTPLLCCLLSSPPLNPHPPAAMNGMMKISIELKRMRSDHPTTVFVQQPATGLAFLHHHATLQCQRVFFTFAAPLHSRRPQARLVQRRKTRIPVETRLRDVFIGSFVFNGVFVNVVRVSLHQNELLLVQSVAMEFACLCLLEHLLLSFWKKKKKSTLHCKCDPGIFKFLISPKCSMS